jgi:transcriptional regulator with XRE-family HTH domain
LALKFDEIVQRLRAYRLGKDLTAAEIAEQLGISRAAVYRLEKGELIKIETLENLANLLDVSLPSLLGVGVEYYSNAPSFFERMRQLEENVVHILGNFSPISFLLLSDDYIAHLEVMLLESAPEEAVERAKFIVQIEKTLSVLAARRALAKERRTPVVSVMGAQDLERFLRIGLIGRFDLPEKVLAERRAAARAEVIRLVDILERQPIGMQVGIIGDMAPTQTFQVFEKAEGAAVTLSPFRLGDQPNISFGIAMATSAPEAVRLFKDTITAQWTRSVKGQNGADLLRVILDRTAEQKLPGPLRINAQ